MKALVLFFFVCISTQILSKTLFVNNSLVKGSSANTTSNLVGSSEHFEFYTSLSGETEYWLELQEKLEVAYLKYKSIWERPSSNTIFPFVIKIKINYCNREEIPHFDANTPAWDCGSYDFQTGEIYVTNLISIEQKEYYGDIASIAVNELAQMALEGWLDRKSEAWYSEGFGLYEMGYRPDRTILLQKLTEIGTENPEIEQIVDISQLNVAGTKDLVASFFESKDLIHCNFYGHWGNDLYKWWQLLKHYYIKDIDRIELLYSTEHFDFWAAAKENPYIESMAINMEEQLSVQESRFNKTMDHRVSVCIYDDEIIKEISKSNLMAFASPPENVIIPHLEIGDYGLIHHEFMHIWVNMLSSFSFDFIRFPGQFLNEGLAESTDGFMTDEEIPWHYYKIEALFYHYERKYNRDPTWLEIVDNAEVNEEDGFWVDAYALGEMYWRYMNDKYPTDFWIKVKEFLQNGRDWSVFGGKTTEQEGTDFIYYLKSLVNYIAPDTLLAIPFEETFQDFSNGWSKPSYNNSDNWQICDDGLNGGNCARFYTNSDKNVPIESWFISPALNAKNLGEIVFSFDYHGSSNGTELEVFYTSKFDGDTEKSNWKSIQKISMTDAINWKSSGKITLPAHPDTLFLGIRYSSLGEQHQQVYLDNFSISEQQVVETYNCTEVYHNSATLNGFFTDEFNATAHQRGFYWSSTNPNPGAADSIAIVETETSEFSFDLVGLIPETTYFFKAFGTDNTGTKTGEVKQFTTLSDLIYQELPFFDGFEETPGDIGVFTKWTFENLKGANFWHIIDWYGNPGHSMRFVKSDFEENDWLITKPINCTGTNQIKVSFDHLYTGTGKKPKFYYTKNYNGKSAESTWIEVNYTLGENENEWINFEEIIIENPGNTLYFAFHYQAAANEGTLFLLDNFKVKSYTPPVPFVLVGNSEHFEFYTNLEGQSDYWQEIQDGLEKQYANLTSLWDRPGVENLFPDTSKIKIIYSQKEDFNIDEDKDYPWKLGFNDRKKIEIYLSPISNAIQQNYYKNQARLAVNEFSQLTVTRQFMRENINSFPVYFLEGFGLYECGERPRRDSLLNLINELGTNVPSISIYNDLSNMPSTSLKDLLVFSVEAKILLGCYYDLDPYGYDYGWSNFLINHYKTESPDRIKLQYSTPRFDIYSSDHEIPYLEQIGEEFELKLDSLEKQYQFFIHHRWNILLYSNKLEGYKDFDGGAAYWGDMILLDTPVGADMNSYLYSFMHHEFMHTFYSHFYYKAPGGFFNEGIANFANGPLPDPPNRIEGNRYKLQWLFYWFQDSLKRDPTFQEIVDNLNDNDIYMLGHLFYTFIYYNYGDYVKIREFWNGGKDYSVFDGKTEEEIGLEYIQFLKELAYFGPPKKSKSLPFFEDFRTLFDGWSLIRFKADDYWQITDNTGFDDQFSAYSVDPYWLEDKEVDSWLVTPTLDASGKDKVLVLFYYKRHGNGIKPEVYYTENFTSIFDSTTWIKIESPKWDAPEGEWTQESFFIQNPPEKLNIKFRFQSTEGNYTSYFIDNFYVEGRITDSKLIELANNNFKIYPNMVTSESIISFTTKTSANVNLTVYDIQGRKICTLLDKKLNAGTHTIPLGNQIQTNGVYLCKLATSDGISTIKLIVNNK